MPRKPRIEFLGALYHVIARGNHRQNIFFDDNDRNRYLSTIEKSKSKFNFSIYAFVLMSNHVHLLMERLERCQVLTFEFFWFVWFH